MSTEYYDRWEQIAREEEQTTAAQQAADKAVSDSELGLDKDEPRSAAEVGLTVCCWRNDTLGLQAEARAKQEALREAKKK